MPILCLCLGLPPLSTIPMPGFFAFIAISAINLSAFSAVSAIPVTDLCLCLGLPPLSTMPISGSSAVFAVSPVGLSTSSATFAISVSSLCLCLDFSPFLLYLLWVCPLLLLCLLIHFTSDFLFASKYLLPKCIFCWQWMFVLILIFVTNDYRLFYVY